MHAMMESIHVVDEVTSAIETGGEAPTRADASLVCAGNSAAILDGRTAIARRGAACIEERDGARTSQQGGDLEQQDEIKRAARELVRVGLRTEERRRASGEE